MTAIGIRAGTASMTPVQRTPIQPARSPSLSEASGLLPAQAMAQTAITAATRVGPAALDSNVRVAELATRQLIPAPRAAATLTQTHGVMTKNTMQPPRSASAVAASLSEGKCLERRRDPTTLPPPSAA